MPYKLVKPVIDLSVRQLCKRPYCNHPRGCPNYGKKSTCPPKALPISKVLDLSRPVYAIWNEFDFAGHCNRMKAAHPGWSQRQIECCLYWQPKARKQLRAEISIFAFSITQYIIQVLTTPEATGVNVTATMKTIGIKLEWPPRNRTYQVALAGPPLIGKRD